MPLVTVEVLGPLRLTVHGRPVEVPGPRRRALLALLALARGRSVTVDELLAAVWPDEVPESGRRALHSHVSRLRGHLGPEAGRLVRDGDGYRFDLGPDELDVTVVEALAEQVRKAPPAEAATAAREALARWRGTALDEFADVGPLAAEATALAELRLDLVDALLEARVAQGGDPGLASDAARAAAAEPLRERTHLALARALAGEHRTAEALRVLHDFRVRLGEETGLDPSPALLALESEIAAGVLAVPPAATTRTSVARPLGPLVGRDQELARARQLTATERLVTVVGPGGVGKTRLTLELAATMAEEADREVVVVLLATADPSTVLLAVANALGLREQGSAGLLAAVVDRLAPARTVLVLDNCEHVLDACRDLVAALVAACPQLTVVATSREPLGLPGEQVLRLPPLAVPAPGASAEDVAASPAVVAFRLHAARRDEHFRLDDEDLRGVAEIVRRLDGLPLALELAAGRAASLSVPALRDRLGRALDLLESGRAAPDQRHRTLRSTIEWSYRLLREDEQRLALSLAPLPAGFALDTAEDVAARLGVPGDAAAHLARLVDASVVTREPGPDGGRYLLLETVRAFLLDELERAGEVATVEVVLAEASAALARRLGVQLLSDREEPTAGRLMRELANLGMARVAALHHGRPELAVEICVELGEAALWRGLPELNGWSLELALRPDAERLPRAAELLGTGARAAWLRGELDLTLELATAGLRVARTPKEASRNQDALATRALFRGELDESRRLYLAAREGNPRQPTLPASAALAAVYQGDVEGARALLAEARALATDRPAPTLLAYNQYVAGEVEAALDPAAAIEAYSTAIDLARRAGAGFVEGVASVGLVSVWTATRQLQRALQGFAWLVEHWRRTGGWTQQWTTLRNLASLLVELGDHQTAATLLAAADHAAEAAALADDASTARAWTAIHAAVGDAGVAAARERAASLPRLEVVAESLAAIDRHQAAG